MTAAVRLGVALAAVWVAVIPAAALAAPEYPVHVDSEVQPALGVEDVVRIVQEAMQRAGRLTAAEAPGSAEARIAAEGSPILSVDCVRGDQVDRVVGRSSVKRQGATLWVVRARGRFSKNVPGGGSIVNDSGYYIVDDATGTIIAVGSPADRR